MFLSRAQTQNLLMADRDGFVSRMGPMDLVARHVSTKAEYLAKAAQSADDFTPHERDVLWREAQRADEFLAGGPYTGIPWCFAKARYEEGLPHTRGSVIFLVGIADASTLVHEMVHVCQKARGPRIPPGYVKSSVTFKNMRTNPDTDGRAWFKGTVPADAFYRSERPSGLTDVVQYVEHPFEAEAYAVSRRFPSP